jgi:hypothetical protein
MDLQLSHRWRRFSPFLSCSSLRDALYRPFRNRTLQVRSFGYLSSSWERIRACESINQGFTLECSRGLFREDEVEVCSSLMAFCWTFFLLVICGGALHEICTSNPTSHRSSHRWSSDAGIPETLAGMVHGEGRSCRFLVFEQDLRLAETSWRATSENGGLFIEHNA